MLGVRPIRPGGVRPPVVLPRPGPPLPGPQPLPPVPPGSGVEGDPHLMTWGGHKWDYHGECDLIALHNPNFANGLGLELHIRLTRDYHYSYTNEAVLKIGDDTFEVHSMSQYKKNGIIGDYTNTTGDLLGGFPLSHWHSGGHDNLYLHRHYIQLGDKGEKIEIKTFENIIYVHVVGSSDDDSDLFRGTTGLFGDAATGKMLGRDGVTIIEDPDEYAAEWQVRDTDQQLFSTIRAPQFPDECLPPHKFVTRLGQKRATEEAEKLCEAWGDDKTQCVFDIVATRNKGLANFKEMEAEAEAEAEA